MLNTVDLEKRWLVYKIKSYTPYAIIFFSVLIILATILIFTNKNNSISESNITTTEFTNEKVMAQTPKVEVVKDIKEKTLEVQAELAVSEPSETLNNKMTLSPSLNFIKKMQHSSQPYYINETNTNYNKKEEKISSPTKAAPIKEEQIIEEVQDLAIEEEKPVDDTYHTVNIKRQNTEDDINDIIQRFKKNNNPALSLFVAKKYYEMQNYSQAYNYALITNEINKDIESSWIIFAKSLVKLNKKDKAIDTLTQYIEYSHSNSAKILLDEIKSGKFK